MKTSLRAEIIACPTAFTGLHIMNSARISITANGQRYEVPTGQLLPTFLESLGQQPKLVVVERNRRALTPSETRTAVLAEGDVLEIVRIVAGG